MLLTEFAIACNNEGAQLFECENYKYARRMFQTAMTIMQLIAQGIISQESSFESFLSSCSTIHLDQEQQNKIKWAWQIIHKTRGSIDTTESCLAQALSSNEQETNKNHPGNLCNTNSVCCMNESSETTACTTYCKPIQLLDMVVAEEQDGPNMLLEFYATAMIFNMGLMYHIGKSKSLSISSFDSLKNALGLYDIAYSTLKDHHDNMIMSGNYPRELFLSHYRLLISIMNNVAQIHEELGSFDSMRLCLGSITSFFDELALLAPSLSNADSAEYVDFLEEMSSLILFAEVFEVSVASAA
jgi:hypothetical protein